MSKAAELAALIGSQSALSNRNLIINGAMQVAQRSTSVTGITTSGYRTVDRYQININTAGTWSISQSTTAPTGFANSLKMDCTTADASLAAGDYVLIKMHIEGQDLQQLKKGTADAEAVTASFWVRSAKTGAYTFEIVDGDNSRTISASYTISSANTWEHKTITIPGDTTGTLDNDANSSFQINWWLAAGSNFSSGTLATAWASQTNANRAVGNVNLADSTSNDWYMTGFQLEVGETATPFEHRSYGDELARCQRYFYRVSDDDRAIYAEQGPATDQLWWNFGFPTEMRVRPDFTVYGATNKGQAGKAYDTGGGDYESVETTHYSTLTRGHILIVRGTSNTNYSIQGAEFDAEL